MSSNSGLIKGGIEIGCVSHKRSSPNSISIYRETPSISSINTYGNLLTTRTGSIV